ncbi:MAG: BatD family protein [Candidatus Omnitrophota bacterium]
MHVKSVCIKIFLSGILYLSLASAVFAAATIGIQCNKTAIGPGEKIKVIAIVEQTQTETNEIAEREIRQITPPACSLLQMIDCRQSTSTQLKKDKIITQRTFAYDFSAKETGAGEISALIIEYANKNNPEDIEIIKSKTINIKVLPFWQRWGPRILKNIFWGLIIAAGIILIKFRKAIFKQKQVYSTPALEIELEKIFLEKLEAAQKHILEAQMGEYYEVLKQALAEYLQKKYQCFSLNIQSLSKAKAPQEVIDIFSDLNQTTEKVKFSGYAPLKSEQEKVFRNLKLYFQNLIKSASIEKIDTIEPKE